MKDFLIRLVRAYPDPSQRRNLAREYLQARILQMLQRSSAFIRFHGLPRELGLSAQPDESLATLSRKPDGKDLSRTPRTGAEWCPSGWKHGIGRPAWPTCALSSSVPRRSSC